MNSALGGEWSNNTTQIMMGRQVQKALATAAFQQNAIAYEQITSQGGLRIYAAPWSYAFCGKLNRLCTDARRPYDLADAVIYLREYLQTENRQTVSAREIFHWDQQYERT